MKNAMFLVAAVVLFLAAGPSIASAGVGEVLYLSDTLDDTDGLGNNSQLFQVSLDPDLGRANLVPLADVGYGAGIVPFDRVVALAGTPDGSRLYAIDYVPANGVVQAGLGYYDVGGPSWNFVGYVDVARAAQGVFSPDGVLYAVSSNYDSLYSVDTGMVDATLLGLIVNEGTGATVDVAGADLVFDSWGRLYMWTNGSRQGAPYGFYKLSLPAEGGVVDATYLGNGGYELLPDGSNLVKGMAVRGNGLGHIVASTQDDLIVEFRRKCDGTFEVVGSYAMYEGGSPYDYLNGDMCNGPLVPCTRGVGEVLCLSDTLDDTDGVGNDSQLFQVSLDPDLGRANLVPLADVGYGAGIVPFDRVVALAGTPDGSRLYAIDYVPANGVVQAGLGYYDVGGPSWNFVGYVDVARAAQGVFSPDGVLYAVSSNYDSLYSVDTGMVDATLLGLIVNEGTGATVDVAGADLVFDSWGRLYMWTNGSRQGAPYGFYKLSLPAEGGVVDATYLGNGGYELLPDGSNLVKGMAVRGNGLGHIVASTQDDLIVEFRRKCDGTFEVVGSYAMYEGGSPYDYLNGDMSNGPLVLCTRSKGYWKTHPWNGATVTICGVEVDEAFGKEIMWNANASNFSMFFAQLIVAKLNVFDATGVPAIDEAEAWLCAQPDIMIGGSLNWDKSFDSKDQKREARDYWWALNCLNHQFRCACGHPHLGDGPFCLGDVIRMLRWVLGMEFPKADDAAVADLDCDGALGLSDVINGLRLVVGMEPLL